VAVAPPVTERVLTVPNALSVLRLACIPVFLWLLFVVDSPVAAGVLLGVLGVTDWVDGYVARHFHQVSELGKVLDPAADRLLFIVCVGGIVVAGGAPLWFSVLVVVREASVGGALVVLTLLGMKRFDVAWVGKAGTFGLMVAFPLFLIGSGGDGGAYAFSWTAGYVVGVPSLVVSYYAAISYVPTMRAALTAGRELRQP
jgi:cardiolipin synthase